MEKPIIITRPNTEQLIRGAAVNLAFRFGMQTAKPFEPTTQIGQNGNSEFAEIKEMEGVPYITSLILESSGKKFEFVDCVITVHQEKTIVTTTLQGRNGTIKEYISDGDYTITLDVGIDDYEEGYQTGAVFDYPKNKMEQLYTFLSEQNTLIVYSPFLLIFDIKSAVVKSFNIIQQTHNSRQNLSITMLSDTPYEIKLKEEKDVKAV